MRRSHATDRVFWGALRAGLPADRGARPSRSSISVVPPGLAGPRLVSCSPSGPTSIGLQNAILGTLLLLLGVLIVAGTIGVGAGIYLAEFASRALASRSLRFFSEVLAGMPSIVIGYIGYVTLVVQFHWGYSLLAAIIALSVLVLPYIVKTTEVALRAGAQRAPGGRRRPGAAPDVDVGQVLLPPAFPASSAASSWPWPSPPASWPRCCSPPASPTATRPFISSTTRCPT